MATSKWLVEGVSRRRTRAFGEANAVTVKDAAVIEMPNATYNEVEELKRAAARAGIELHRLPDVANHNGHGDRTT